MPTYTLPNLLGMVRAFLAAHADVSALVADRVHVLRMPPTPVFPLVLLSEVVESPLITRTDKLAVSDVQVECYGSSVTDERAARDLAAICHAALHDLDTYAHPSAGVTSVSTLVGLQNVPDAQLDKARWLFEVRIVGYTR